jgi:hypothetical protein
MEDENKDMMQEPQPDYEKAELDLLRDALKRNYKERFLMATRLYKIQKTISKAKIIRKPYILPKSCQPS